MSSTSIVIKNAPEEFRPFLEAGDDFEGSDDAQGIINTEKEAEHSLEIACGFSDDAENTPAVDTCIRFIDFIEKNGGMGPSGTTAYFRGHSYLIKKENEKAREYLEQASKDNVKPLQVNLDLGRIMGRLDRFEEAIGFFQKALALDKNHIMGNLMMALVLARMNDPAGVRSSLNTVLNLDPQNPEALRMLGELHNLESNYQQAADCFKKAVESKRLKDKKQTAEMYVDWSLAVLNGKGNEKERLDEGLRLAEEAERHDPDNWRAKLVKGQVYQQLQRPEDALLNYKQALELEPDTKETKTGLLWQSVRILFDLDRFDEAIQYLEKFSALSENNKGLYQHLLSYAGGKIAMKNNRHEEAIQHFKEALATDANNPAAYVNLSHSLFIAGNFKEAEDCVNQAVAKEIGGQDMSVEWQLMQAEIFIAKDKTAEAIELLSKIKGNNEQLLECYLLSAVALLSAGRTTEAEGFIKKAAGIRDGLETSLVRAYAEFRANPKAAAVNFELFVEEFTSKGKGKIILRPVLFALFQNLNAITHATEGVATDPNDYLIAGMFLNDTGRFQEALECTKKAAQLSPDNAFAYALLANIYRSLGDNNALLASCWKALELDPAFEGIYLQTLISISNITGRSRNDELAKLSEIIGKADPDSKYLLIINGLTQADNGNYEEAVNQFDGALKAFSDSSDEGLFIHILRTNVLLNIGRFAEADEEMKKIPESQLRARQYALWSDILRSMGRFDDAIEKNEKAIKLARFADDKITAYNVRCHIYLDRGDYQTGLQFVEEALRSIPKETNLLVYKAFFLLGLGRSDEAQTLAESILKINPDDEESNQLMANIAIRTRNTEAALAYSERAVKGDPNNYRSLLLKGIALLLLKKYNEAVQLFKNVIKINPSNARAQYYLGQALANLKQFDAALDAFNTALSLNPDPQFQAFTHYQRGIALNNLKRQKEAADDLSVAAGYEQFPNETKLNIYENLAWSLIKLERFDEAATQYKKMLEMDPKSGFASYGLAVISFKRGDLGETDRLLDEAIKYAPDMEDPYFVKGQIKLQQDKFDEAIKWFDEAIKHGRTDEAVFGLKAVALSGAGKFDEAISTLEGFISGHPETIDARFVLAILLFNKEETARTLDVINKVLELKPNFLEARIMRAKCLATLKRPKDALSDLEFVTSRDPKNIIGRFWKGVLLLEELNDYSGALNELSSLMKNTSAKDLGELNYYGNYAVAKANYMLGRADDALTWLNATIAIGAKVSDPYYLLAQIYAGMGEFDKADEALDRAYDINKIIDPSVPIISKDEILDLRRDILGSQSLQEKLDRLIASCEKAKKRCEELSKSPKGEGDLISFWDRSVELQDCIRLNNVCGESFKLDKMRGILPPSSLFKLIEINTSSPLIPTFDWLLNPPKVDPLKEPMEAYPSPYFVPPVDPAGIYK